MIFDSDTKPEIHYPCLWEYKLIGQDEFAMRRAIADILAELDYTVTFSRSSRTGKYRSLQVTLTVADETQRVAIFTSLKSHQDIVMVL